MLNAVPLSTAIQVAHRRSPGRPTVAQRLAIHTIILESAWQEFVEHGYGSATTQRIADRAGVSIATFYHHFEGKAAVFAETLTEVGTALSAEVASLRPDTRLEDGLRHFARAFLTLFDGTHYAEAARLLYAEARRFPELCAMFVTLTIPWVAALSDFLERFRPDLGEAALDDLSRMFAEMVAGPLHRARMLGMAWLTEDLVSSHIETCVTIFVHGATCRQARPPGGNGGEA